MSRLPARATRPSAESLFKLGLRFSTAMEGGMHDQVAAHALFELAARLGSIEAKIYCHELSEEMNPEDLALARDLARDWLAGA